MLKFYVCKFLTAVAHCCSGLGRKSGYIQHRQRFNRIRKGDNNNKSGSSLVSHAGEQSSIHAYISDVAERASSGKCGLTTVGRLCNVPELPLLFQVYGRGFHSLTKLFSLHAESTFLS